MNRFLTCALCGVASLATASVADAQIVRWGPRGVRVRAPFVAVDVSPFGGTRVRAPFTAVDSRVYGGYAYPPGVVVGPVPPVPPIPFPGFAFPAVPVYPAPVYPGVVYPAPAPTEYRAARPSLEASLPEQLRSAAEMLARSLAVRQDGDVWLDYLGPQTIIETIDLGRSPEALRPLVVNYDGVMSNGSLAAIRSARGFAETRDLLKYYVAGRDSVAPATSAPANSVGNAGVIARPDAAVRTQPELTVEDPREEALPAPAPDDTPEPAPENSEPAPVPPPPSPRPPAGPKPTPL